MKSSRMKFAKKLKSFKAGEYLNQDRILQVLSAADGISEFLPKMYNPIPQITSGSIWRSPQKLEDQIATATENEREEADQSVFGDKENIRPLVNQIPKVPTDQKKKKLAESYGSDKVMGNGFRRPDLNSSTLFDPKLLEAFELVTVCFRKKIKDFSRDDDEENNIAFPEIGIIENTISSVIGIEEENKRKDQNVECDFQKDVISLRVVDANEEGEDGVELLDPLLEFEERCPPGGEGSVVFYTTTLRGIRKTFDDCNMIRFLLDSFKVKYYERDVSMHREYKEELRRVSSAKEETEVVPPLLFVKGRCIGGAQRVLSLHEQGKFKVMFEGVPKADQERCGRCDGFRFVMCEGCRGSRRIIERDGTRTQCLICNENGLVVCFDCSS